MKVRFKSMPWWDEQHQNIAKSANTTKEATYAENLHAKYGIEMNKMVKAMFDDATQTWVRDTDKKCLFKMTDDGCRHYLYEGKHYRLSYLFHDSEWFVDGA